MKQQLEQLKQEYQTLEQQHQKQQDISTGLFAEINKLDIAKNKTLQNINTYKNLGKEVTGIIAQHKLQMQKYQVQQDINTKLSIEISKLNDDKKNSLQQIEIYKKLSLKMTNILANHSPETNGCKKDVTALFTEMLQQNSQNNNDVDDNKEEAELSGNIIGYD